MPFSKKIENHAHGVALHFMHYNSCRQHKSLDGINPAMAAGVTDRLWDIRGYRAAGGRSGPEVRPRAAPTRNRIQTDPLPTVSPAIGRL